jgi:hypothetical protein
MFKIYYYFTICLVCFILYKYCKQKIQNYLKTKETVYKLDETEIDVQTNYNLLDAKEVSYLFWSGGYNSTFRLCQLLLIEEKPVQTIYIYNDTPYMMNEIKAIKKIRNNIISNYPILKQKFPPTRYIISIKENKNIIKQYDDLHNKYGFLDKSRDYYKTFEKIALYSDGCDYLIECCINKDNDDLTRLFNNTTLEDYNFRYHKKIKKKEDIHLKELTIFHNLILPVITYNKKELKEYAIINVFYHIMLLTWSCENKHNINNNNSNQTLSQCKRCYKCINSPIFIP